MTRVSSIFQRHQLPVLLFFTALCFPWWVTAQKKEPTPRSLAVVRTDGKQQRLVLIPKSMKIGLSSGKKYREVSPVILSDSTLIIEKDTILIHEILFITASVKRPWPVKAAGILISGAGALPATAGLIYLPFAVTYQEYLSPSSAYAMMAVGMGMGVTGYLVGGLKRKFSLQKKWTLEVINE
ncbi:hypothetical protein [Marinoscillum sp. 108]|uniref:hypothetical protein n=1 Tax=Marinoscillum sp. 108 TaxID=2653151 RepID=UPI0012F362E4|nr:hypothetical protein [Marinoscillum sp. 108]VXD10720.1 hypothetical protein MARINOS108_10201 [Marinoscillum sp. 108]